MRLSRLPGPSSALGQHLLGLASVLLVVGVVVLWLTGARANQQADRHADQLVRSTALTLALPLTGEDIAGDVTWQARLDDAVAPLIADDEIVTAHVWNRIDDTMGELIWSSSPDRIGDVVPLGGAAEALDTGEAVTERLADGHQSEGPMLPDLYEAYLPFHDRTGTAYVLEIYKPVREYDEIRGDLLRDWLPIALLGIVAVGAITLPLSLRLARAAARAERDRTAFADRALRARAEEHRRIAEVLHERTVQDLSAARLMLDAVRDLPRSDEVGAVLDRTAEIIGTDVAELRELLTTGEATEWQSDDLASALAGWTGGVSGVSPGVPAIETAIDAGAALPLAEPAVALAFRIVKEAVRNAVKHADARRVRVAVQADDDAIDVTVTDDGSGLAPGAEEGVGLRIMRAAAAAGAGTLAVDSRPGEGTRVVVRLPRSGGRTDDRTGENAPL